MRRVAVVGNAPLGPDEARADELDGVDLVIRVNALSTDRPGGPRCVGRRCHAVIVSRYAPVTPDTFRDYRRRAYLIPQAGYGLRYVLHEQAGFWPADLGTMPIPNGALVKPLMDLLDPDHVPNQLIPTSGTTACYLAHELFPQAEMVAAGFSFLDGLQQESWRYHGGGGSPVIESHKLDLEARLLRSWVQDGSMRVLS